MRNAHKQQFYSLNSTTPPSFQRMCLRAIFRASWCWASKYFLGNLPNTRRMTPCTLLLMVSIYFPFQMVTSDVQPFSTFLVREKNREMLFKVIFLPFTYKGTLNGQRSSKLQNICIKFSLQLLGRLSLISSKMILFILHVGPPVHGSV